MKWDEFEIGFWHPFGDHSGETRDQIIRRKQEEIRRVGFQRFMTANSTCVINKGGNVKTDRQLGNPNHCVINSVKIGDLKGCWR